MTEGKCEICGTPFMREGTRRKRCDACREELRKASQADWYRRSLNLPGRRHSGFDDRKVDLDAIRRKYAGGVTKEILGEFLGIKDWIKGDSKEGE